MNYFYIVLVALVIILAAKFIFGVGGGTLKTLIINALVGTLAMWLINLTGIMNIPLNWITILLAGILGIPGVILVVILVLLKVI